MSERPNSNLLRRLLFGSALGTGSILLLVAVLAAWLLATQSGAAFVLGRAVALAGGQVSGVEGRLVGPLAAEALTIVGPRLHLRLRKASLDWSPLHLLAGEVRLDRVHAASLEIDSVPAGDPGKAPLTLVPPIKIHVAMAGLDRLRIGTIGQEGGVELREVSVKLAGDAAAWILGEAQASTPAGRAKLAGTLGARSPFNLDMKGELSGERRGTPYRLSFEAGGELARIAVAFDGKEGDLRGNGKAAIEPLSKLPLRSLVGKLEGVDLAAFAAAPRTKLTIEANLVPQGEAFLAGPVTIVNADPGPLDKGRLPVASLATELSIRKGRIDADRLVGTFAPGGRAEGRATWSEGKIDAKLRVTDADLLSWHSALRPTRLAGEIVAVASEAAQSFNVELSEPRFGIAGDVTIAQGRVTVGKARFSRGEAFAEASGSIAVGGTRDFDVQGRVQAFDPAVFARLPAGDVNGTFHARGSFAKGLAGELQLEIAKSRFAGLAAEGRAQLSGESSRLARADADLSLGTTHLTTRGALGEANDTLEVRLASPDLAPLGRAFGVALGGKVDLDARVTGTFAAPSGRGLLIAENLLLPGDVRIAGLKGSAQLDAGDSGVATGSFDARGLTRGADRMSLAKGATATLKGTRASHEVRVSATFADESTVRALLDGGLVPGAPALAWRGRLESFESTGRTALALVAPAPLYASAERVELGEANFGGDAGIARIALARWTPSTLETRGTSQGIVLRAILRALDLQPQANSNLVLSAGWDVRIGESLDGFVEVKRERGDLRIGEPRQALGLETLVLRADATAGRVSASADIRGANAGRWLATAAATVRRGEEGFEISPVAPLEGRFTVDVPDLSWTAAWLGAEAKAGGRLKGEAMLAGTRRDPQWSGRLEATGLAVREPALGTEVGDGTIVLVLADREVRIERFELTAPWTPGPEAAQAIARAKRPVAGTLTAQGAMDLGSRKGSVTFRSSGYPLTRLAARFLAVSGEGRVDLDGAATAIAGDFTADAGWFGIPDSAPPALSDDVIVDRGQEAAAPRGAERVRLDLRFDFGDHLYFRGRGLATRLAGNLRLAGDAGATLRTTGTIRAVGGTFDAYGRTLAIERGALNFQGPIDNPGLNVLALRKGLPVEAGVEVLGTVSRPKVRLVSSPDVADPEKLSWLVLGRGQGEVSAGDAATLVTAANSILGRDTLPAGKILRGLGLEDVSVGRDSGSTLGTLPQSTVAGRTGSTSSADVVTVGRRLTDDIYVSYRQGLADAEGSVRFAWQLTRSLQLILRAGHLPGVDAVYRFTFD